MQMGRRGYLLGLCLVLVSVLTAGPGGGTEATEATEMLLYRRLAPISENVNSPTAVAVDGRGRVYVAESREDQLLVFGAGGQLLRTRGGVLQPISVTVTEDGTVLVGSGASGSVQALTADLQPAFQLGAGSGEFQRPTGLAVAADGSILVADHDAHQIKIYRPDGTPATAFGASGSGDGTINFPLDVDVDLSSGEIFVVDHLSANGGLGDRRGGRVQVFSPAGEFLRSFGEVGMGAGRLARPVGVQTDGTGRVYVTDALQNQVQVFSTQGSYLGLVADSDYPMRTPLGIAFDADAERLLIASQNTRRVERFQLFEGGYRVSVVLVGEGSVEPAGPLLVEAGGEVDFRFTPAAGFDLREVTVDGEALAVEGGVARLPALSSDRVVTVVFAAQPEEQVLWDVVVTAGSGGSVEPSGTVRVEQGEGLVLVLQPDADHALAEVRVDGVAVAGDLGSTYTLAAVAANHAVTVFFEPLADDGGEPGSEVGGGGGSPPEPGPDEEPVDPPEDSAEQPPEEPEEEPGAEDAGSLLADAASGLTWSLDAACGGVATWQEALARVADINADLVADCGGGYADWRLPNAREVESLLARCAEGGGQGAVCAQASGWLTAAGLELLAEGSYWSSTTYAAETDRAWVLDVASGQLTTQVKAEAAYFWPVRSTSDDVASVWQTGQGQCFDLWGEAIACAGTGQDGEFQRGRTWPQPRFADNGEGTTTDRLTGLSWLNDPDCLIAGGEAEAAEVVHVFNQDPTAYACRDYARSYADWRLPRVGELNELIDFSGQAAFSLAIEAADSVWSVGTDDSEVQLWSTAPERAAAAGAWQGQLWLVREGASEPDAVDGDEPGPVADAGDEVSGGVEEEPVVPPTVDGTGGGGGSGGMCFIGTSAPDRQAALGLLEFWKRLGVHRQGGAQGDTPALPRAHDLSRTGGR